MKDLKNKLDTLCIFRELQKDSVISALYKYLEEPSARTYAGFAASLYEANGGRLTEYVRDLCEKSENIYVKTVGSGKKAPDYMYDALVSELETLQRVSELTKDELCRLIDDPGFLPDYETGPLGLKDSYLYRTGHLDVYGYGIYAKNRMFYADRKGRIVPVLHPDTISLSELIDYERERQVIIDNTKALIEGRPAANILLTGDAGTGKSSTVKAVVNEYWKKGLRIIEFRKDRLCSLEGILDSLASNPLKFILFIDDLSFSGNDDNFNALKAVLEGSVAAKSRNVVIYATSNRRHMVKESFADRSGDDVHINETMQELVSLSDRFGIHVTFSKPDKKTYLHIVRKMAEDREISIQESELELLAEKYALKHGGRTARLARQLVDRLTDR